MTKNGIMTVALVITIILIIIGVIVMNQVLTASEEENVIKVHIEDQKTETVEFKGLSLIPGDSCEYVIKLTGDRASAYDLAFDFVETEEGTLKEFVWVKILSQEAQICDMLLKDALSKDDLVLPVDFGAGKNTELTIIYYLPHEVGNEAKNAKAIFELRLTANIE